uniref:Putative secreted peptide n=1 Tax=Anopheles braziliensis TaxID=58242 RepID=A0A2M3ZS65_9DIPT
MMCHPVWRSSLEPYLWFLLLWSVVRYSLHLPPAGRAEFGQVIHPSHTQSQTIVQYQQTHTLLYRNRT